MTMAAQASLIPLCLFFLLPFHFLKQAYLARSLFGETTDQRQHKYYYHHYHVNAVLRNVCSSHSFTNEVVRRSQVPLLPITHRDGPCSPTNLYTTLQDSSRADLPATSGASLDSGNYIVTVGFGTPVQNYSLIFNTGSDLTWMQCQPCYNCYDQEQPIFNPSGSHTYSKVPRSAPECSNFEYHVPGRGTPSTCAYDVHTQWESSPAKHLHSRQTTSSQVFFWVAAAATAATSEGQLGY